MDGDALLRVIRTMRHQLLSEYGDVDPMPQKTRAHVDELLGNDRSLDRLARVSWFGFDDSFSSAIVRLVNTPRTLKHVLRHTHDLWQKLHGEIDFDDLMVSTILRFTAAGAYDFVLRHIDVLRMVTRNPSTESNRVAAEKQQQDIQADWNETAKEADWDTAAKQLLLFLFPNAANCFGEKHVENRNSPQGIQHCTPIDYWGRMLAGEIEPSELRDQTVLRRMVEWSQSPSNGTLANDLSSSSRFVEVWEYFAEWVPVPNLLDLAGQVLDQLRMRCGAKASGDKEHGAVLALWRRAHNTLTKDDSGREWLLDQINRSMAISLRLVNDLYYYWASICYGVVATEQDRNVVRQRVVEQAKHVFVADKADVLVEALAPEYPYAVRQLVQPVDQKEPPSILTQPSEWQWLSPILLTAATRAPVQIIPDIVFLVTDSDHNAAWEIHTQWNQVLLEGIFGADLPHLMEVLSTDFQMVSVPSDPAAQIKVQNARELARQWRKEHFDQAGK